MKKDFDEMTPKEAYEARKAERAKLADLEYQTRTRTETVMMLDTFDRFVTAVERIADALDQPQPVRIGPGIHEVVWPKR